MKKESECAPTLYRVADLIVDIPAGGGLASLCGDYLCREADKADVVIEESRYREGHYGPNVRFEVLAYMESAYQFYLSLLRFGGLYLHASAVALDGYGYLFSGSCGAGKSTHTRLWKTTFGDAAVIFNDDKPAMRRIDGKWFAYGTPWCGKSHINENMRVPLGGICFVRQAAENRIRRLSAPEALASILTQTIHTRLSVEETDLLLPTMEKLITEVPVFELECRIDEDAARLSHETMRRAAKEASL